MSIFVEDIKYKDFWKFDTAKKQQWVYTVWECQTCHIQKTTRCEVFPCSDRIDRHDFVKFIPPPEKWKSIDYRIRCESCAEKFDKCLKALDEGDYRCEQ